MKLKSLLLLGLVVGVSSWASAATVSITNFDNPTFSAVLTSSGSLVASGVVSLGYYTGAEPSSSLNVLSGFTQLGTLAFTNGYIQGDISAAIPTGNAAVGKQVYLIIGNAASVGASSEVLVWKATSNPAGNTYTADNPVGGPDLVRFFTTTGAVVIGQTLNSDVGAGSQPNFRLTAVVPEPSTALLGAVGALGLLRRRRN